MITEEQVYIYFRQAQSEAKNKPYRLPKDFEKHKDKMSKKNRESLEEVTKYFNTKWNNINVKLYMKCGFEIWKNFSYHQFLNGKIMQLYIRKDKAIKLRNIEINKDLNQGNQFVNMIAKKYDFSDKVSYKLQYCQKKINGLKLPIYHYINNEFGKYFFVYLLKRNYFEMEKEDWNYVPIIRDNLNKLKVEIEDCMKGKLL